MAEPRSIFLVRHLPTAGRPTGRIDRDRLASWLAGEDGWEIALDASVAAAFSEAVTASVHLVVSPATRAQQTATTVLATVPRGHAPEVVTLEELREAPLPVVAIPWLRAPLDLWGVVARSAWFLGCSDGVEPRTMVAARARRAARALDHMSGDGPVTVVAHGFFNIMLAGQLRRLGWSGRRLPRHRHGAVNPYTRATRF
jgi:broad specificity phosphatase PhoE